MRIKKKTCVFIHFVRSFIALIRHSAHRRRPCKLSKYIYTLCSFFFFFFTFCWCALSLSLSPDNMSLLLFFHSLRIAFDDIRSCCSYLFTHTLHVRRLSRLIQNTRNVCTCEEVLFRLFFPSLRRSFFFSRKNTLVFHLQSPLFKNDNVLLLFDYLYFHFKQITRRRSDMKHEHNVESAIRLKRIKIVISSHSGCRHSF